jgi:hypothetical protein
MLDAGFWMLDLKGIGLDLSRIKHQASGIISLLAIGNLCPQLAGLRWGFARG